MRAVMRREFEVFGDVRFGRLARVSTSHLHNLHKSRAYVRHGVRAPADSACPRQRSSVVWTSPVKISAK